MRAAEPGDIVLFRLNTGDWKAWFRPWALLIAWLQGNPVTHTALVADPEWGLIIEAYYPRVRLALFEDTLWDGCYEWDIVRPRESSEEDRKAAVSYALKLVGRRYDLRSLYDIGRWLLVEKFLGVFLRNRVAIRGDDKKFFCQELVTECYRKAGYDFAGRLGFEDPAAVLPKDLDDKEKFIWIESSYTLVGQ